MRLDDYIKINRQPGSLGLNALFIKLFDFIKEKQERGATFDDFHSHQIMIEMERVREK
jgi:hypothetical protein